MDSALTEVTNAVEPPEIEEVSWGAMLSNLYDTEARVYMTEEEMEFLGRTISSGSLGWSPDLEIIKNDLEEEEVEIEMSLDGLMAGTPIKNGTDTFYERHVRAGMMIALPEGSSFDELEATVYTFPSIDHSILIVEHEETGNHGIVCPYVEDW